MNQFSCSVCEDLLAQQRVESLSSDEMATVKAHIYTCAACAAYAQTLERLSSALDDAPLPAPHLRQRLRARIPSPTANLLQKRVPLYQVALGAAAVLLLFVVDAPAPQRGADTPLSPAIAVTAAADTYEVSANLRLLDTARRGLGEDSLMIHFPTSVSSI